MRQEVGGMSLLLEILTALLAAFGLVCLGWLIFGRLVLPVGTDGPAVRAVVAGTGDGSGLEQTVGGLLWLRRSGLWRGTVVIVDRGMDPGGLALARSLAQRTGVELRTGVPSEGRP